MSSILLQYVYFSVNSRSAFGKGNIIVKMRTATPTFFEINHINFIVSLQICCLVSFTPKLLCSFLTSHNNLVLTEHVGDDARAVARMRRKNNIALKSRLTSPNVRTKKVISQLKLKRKKTDIKLIQTTTCVRKYLCIKPV